MYGVAARLTVFKKLPAGTVRSGGACEQDPDIVGYVTEYGYFTVGVSGDQLYIALKEGFDVIHARNPPDTLFVVTGVHELFGRSSSSTTTTCRPNSTDHGTGHRAGSCREGCRSAKSVSVECADVVIATNESYRAIDMERNGRDGSGCLSSATVRICSACPPYRTRPRSAR